MLVEPVRIKGLREFQAQLRAIDEDLPKQLRVVFNDAAELVAADARRRVPTRSGRAKASIKVASQQRKVAVKAGGTRARYYPWLDYGGRVGRKRSVRRVFRPDGRYLYPAYRRHRDDVIDLAAAGMERLARDAGLEVT